MNPLFKKIKNLQSAACVSIILNTHRTHPENEQDPINLKNLVKNAEERLYKDYDKRFVWPIMEKLNGLLETIDHRENLESLLLFVNEEVAEYTRLAIAVEDRVVLDDNFATRDLIRAEHEQEAYYTLVLSKNEARLIEAMNDKPVAEIKGLFPYKNETLYNTEKVRRHTGDSDDDLTREFFNRIDKEIHSVIKNHPLPVMIIADERNYTHFMEIADRKEMYMGYLNKNRGDENAKPHHIIEDVWEKVHEINRDRNAKRVEGLGQAVGSGKFLSDYNEIWKAIGEGRGQTLFVKKGFFQPGKISENSITLTDESQRNEKGVYGDIVDEMIELNVSFGGDIVFLDGDQLEAFQNIALVTRY